MKNPGISVVIPAFNEENFLPDTLESIRAAQTEFQRNFNRLIEVIVVNNCSTDKTRDLAIGLGARVVDFNRRNIAAVRNAGIQAANFDLVITVDADTYVPVNALTNIWEAMLTGKYVGGGVRTAMKSDSAIMRSLLFFFDRFILHGFGISAGMFFFWKSAAERVKGFPEEFMVGEDSVFALLLRRDGRKHGLKFCNLNSVRLLTKDRKRVTVKEGVLTAWHVFRQLLGRRVTKEELGYWYKPDR
jgi:glycosyltransferase involved in cell wall biosynthesis